MGGLIIRRNGTCSSPGASVHVPHLRAREGVVVPCSVIVDSTRHATMESKLQISKPRALVYDVIKTTVSGYSRTAFTFLQLVPRTIFTKDQTREEGRCNSVELWPRLFRRLSGPHHLQQTIMASSKATTSVVDAPVQLPRVTIKFCTQCKWMLRAAYVSRPIGVRA